MKYQCYLEEVGGPWKTVAWIDEHAAIEGIIIQLLKGWYRVVEVYPPPMSNKKLTTKQSYDRKGFPSLKE